MRNIERQNETHKERVSMRERERYGRVRKWKRRSEESKE